MDLIIGEGGSRDKASISLATSKNRPIPNKRMSELAPQTVCSRQGIVDISVSAERLITVLAWCSQIDGRSSIPQTFR
jgi:hypothetical protein